MVASPCVGERTYQTLCAQPPPWADADPWAMRPALGASAVLAVVRVTTGTVGGEDAELVALRVGQHHPAPLAVA